MWNRKSWWWSALWNTLVSLLLAQLNEPNLFSDDVSVSCQIQLLQRVSQRKINGFVSWKSLQWRVDSTKSIIYHLVKCHRARNMIYHLSMIFQFIFTHWSDISYFVPKSNFVWIKWIWTFTLKIALNQIYILIQNTTIWVLTLKMD